MHFVWAAWLVLSWLLLQLFWTILWVALPVIVAAVLCALTAERLIGKEPVRSWARTQSYSLIGNALHRARRACFCARRIAGQSAGSVCDLHSLARRDRPMVEPALELMATRLAVPMG